ncbi:MAG: tetratricopeptide repeat protein [bacterium]|nr:MAG: tetratricopeptide repeat protein [bacterium]
MEKGIHISFGLLIIFSFLVLSSDGYSQDMGAVYWFKKGINEKDHEKKIEYYQKAIQENPKFVEAYYNLALTFMIRKEYNKAEEAFKKALSANPDVMNNSLKTKILNRLGATYRKMGRYTEAEEAYQGALNITKDNKFKALTLYELGQTKILQGQHEEAVFYFRQGMQTSPDDRASFETGIQLARNQQKIDGLYQQGLQLFQDQNFSEAQKIFNEIIEMNPNHEDAKQQIEKIASLLKQKQEQNDQQIQLFYNQAMAYMNEGNWSGAIKYFERIKRLQPNYPDVDKLLSQAQDRQYQQLLNEQKLENFYVKGIENFKNANYAVALVNFEKVAELDPGYMDIASRIQATQREVDRINELANRMSKKDEVTLSESIDNFQLESNTFSSTDVNRQQLFTEKSRQLNAAIDSQLVQNYYKEALDFMQRQEWQRAMILLEKIKLINPDYKNTKFLFAQAKKNIEMANFYDENEPAETTRASFPSRLFLAFIGGIVILPLGLFLLSPTSRAKYYILLKRYDRAREIYERMLSRKPNNVKLYITLANIYINENRVDEIAIRVFERAIQYNDSLKVQLEPIVTRYYLQKSKPSDTPKRLIQGALKEELEKMGN